MRKHLQIISVALLICASPILANSRVPVFEDYRTPAIIQKKPVNVQLSTAKSRRYASILRYYAGKPIDFAGHYILSSWGCGAGCIMGGVINAKNGNVIMLPFMITDWPIDVLEPLSYEKDSCLFVFEGRRNEGGDRGMYYYKFDGNKFDLIKFVDK